MTPDLAALRAAYTSDPALRTIVDALARGKEARTTTVRRTTRTLARSGSDLPAAEIERVFDRLAAWGLGEILQPNLARRRRMAWRVRLKALVEAAQGRLETFGPIHLLAAPVSDEPAPAPAPVVVPPPTAAWPRHRIPLEPGREAELIFPPDLTSEEARWLGDYLLRMAGKAEREAARRASA